MSFFLFPDVNPVEFSRPFRHRRTQHTREGVVCYFCRALVVTDAIAPCCMAAHEWVDMERARAARSIILRHVKEWGPHEH